MECCCHEFRDASQRLATRVVRNRRVLPKRDVRHCKSQARRDTHVRDQGFARGVVDGGMVDDCQARAGPVEDLASLSRREVRGLHSTRQMSGSRTCIQFKRNTMTLIQFLQMSIIKQFRPCVYWFRCPAAATGCMQQCNCNACKAGLQSIPNSDQADKMRGNSH